MSPVANDPLGGFWMLNPAIVGLIIFAASPLAIWVIELGRAYAHPKEKPPWGLNFSRWATVWLGDTLLAGCVATLAAIYQRVDVGESFFTERPFFIICYAVGLLASVGWIVMEEMTGAYPAHVKINANRLFHFWFFAFMVAVLLAGLRLIFYGKEIGLVILALTFAVGYLVAFLMDIQGKNFVWNWVEKRWPERTTIP